MKAKPLNRYESIPKRSFRNSIIRLLEENYKLLGSHKVIQMIADDIVALHKEFYPKLEQESFGHIVWRTTKATHRKPSYGTKAEDYEVQTVILPLVTDDDIDNRIKSHYSHPKEDGCVNYEKQQERDIKVMARLCKSAAEQGGWLTGAELSVLLNRSLGTIGRYMQVYHEKHGDILPTKGMMLDQGSKPTHKAAIIDLYEQGYPEPDIARLTNHTIESTSRYIKSYKNIKLLLEKNFNMMEIVRVTGLGRSTILQYRDLVFRYHPSLNQENRT
ncbi:DUF1670 domain-containing protein [candidate division KSB1 bacterium]|nr:DUF1670 domain-containing protein [candidate division KSB1 bacterium]RQW01578.1 MAG: DUF1670 domain-containing protein [candidate division KSB1 bacterium]